ncbi:unnamed protein product [Arctogadus glacialis]
MCFLRVEFFIYSLFCVSGCFHKAVEQHGGYREEGDKHYRPLSNDEDFRERRVARRGGRGAEREGRGDWRGERVERREDEQCLSQ